MFRNKAKGTLAQRHMLTAFPNFNRGIPPETYKVTPVDGGSAVYFSERGRVIFYHDGRVKAEMERGASMEWPFNLDILKIRAQAWRAQLTEEEKSNMKNMDLLN